jgi:hypothetical protein
MTRGSIGSTSSVNDMAMFWSTENMPIRMPRSVIMPMPSSDFSHASPSTMSRVLRPKSRT